MKLGDEGVKVGRAESVVGAGNARDREYGAEDRRWPQY